MVVHSSSGGFSTVLYRLRSGSLKWAPPSITRIIGVERYSIMRILVTSDDENVLRSAPQSEASASAIVLADINKRDDDGHIPLVKVIETGSTEAIYPFINANLGLKIGYDDTALHIAADQGEMTAIQELIKHESSLDTIVILIVAYSDYGRDWRIHEPFCGEKNYYYGFNSRGAQVVLFATRHFHDLDRSLIRRW